MNKNRVLALLKEANEDLTEGLTEFGVKACRKIVELEGPTYLGFVLNASVDMHNGNYDRALVYFKKAIAKNRDLPAAWLGLEALFEVFTKELTYERGLMRETFVKIVEIYENDNDETEKHSIVFFKIFERVGDPKGIYLTSGFLLASPNLYYQNEKLKFFLSISFLKACYDGKICLENIGLNNSILDTCSYVMANDLATLDDLEIAWRMHFNLRQKKQVSIVELWRLVTMGCPHPYCQYNAERVIIIFVETYPLYDLDDVLPFQEALPPENFAYRLLSSTLDPNPQSAINTLLEISKERDLLIVTYLRISTLFRLQKNRFKTIYWAKEGLKKMKMPQAEYCLPSHEMTGRFQAEMTEAITVKVRLAPEEDFLDKYSFVRKIKQGYHHIRDRISFIFA